MTNTKICFIGGFVAVLSVGIADLPQQVQPAIPLTTAQPKFPIIHIEPPELTPEGPPPGNAVLVEQIDSPLRINGSIPVTLSRTFAEGEFSDCIQAVVAGIPVETQCDIKTRWPDGSLRHVLLSFWLQTHVRGASQIDFVSALCPSNEPGLDKGQMLTTLGDESDLLVVANATLEGADATERRVSVRDILRTWSGEENQSGVRYWMKGRIATQIIIEDKSPSTQFDFGWRATLPSAEVLGSLDRNQQFITTRDSTGDILGKWRFPLIASIGNELIRICGYNKNTLEICPAGRGLFGTTATQASNGTPIIPNQGWISAQQLQYKSLHPIFVLTFYPGWPGVKIETIVENTWIDRIQDQHYSVKIIKKNPSLQSAWEKLALIHPHGSRWRKILWLGKQPPELRIDHNLPYLIHSRVVPNYDTSLEVKHDAIVAQLKRFANSDMGEPFGSALWQPYFPSTGGRLDIGILPGWYAMYVYTWDASMQRVVHAMAGVSAHVPIHLRESSTSSREFDPYDGAPAAGRVVSIDARPTFFAYGGTPFERNETAPVDRAQAVGPVGRNEWTPDAAHQPGMVYLPYALTGDWYLLEELHFWSSFNLASINPRDCDYCRQGSLGYLEGQMRAQAWALRNLAHAVVMTPAQMPEHSYFYSKLQNNIAIREGKHNVSNGHFYEAVPDCRVPCRSTRWRIGRDIYGRVMENPLQFPEAGNSGLIDTTLIEKGKASAAGSPWMMNFFHSTLGVIEELGFGEVSPLRRSIASNFINQVLHPDYNPFMVGAYRIPTLNLEGQYFNEWASVLSALTPEARSLSRFSEHASTCADCYTDIARGTSTWMNGLFTEQGLSGASAFLWLNNKINSREAWSITPTWAFVPRIPPPELKTVGRMRPSWYKTVSIKRVH